MDKPRVYITLVNRIIYVFLKNKVLKTRWNIWNAIPEFQLQIALTKLRYNCLLKKQRTSSVAIRLSLRQVTVAIRQFLTKRNAIYTLSVALSPTRTTSVIPILMPRKEVLRMKALEPSLFVLVVGIYSKVGNRTPDCGSKAYSLYGLLCSNITRRKAMVCPSFACFLAPHFRSSSRTEKRSYKCI